jgi:hypothetical protein
MTDEDTWLERVVEWRRSGVSAAEFCEGKPYEVGALRTWSSRLGQEGKVERSALGRRRKSTSPSARSAVTFARVVSVAEPKVDESAVRCVDALGGLVVAVGSTRIEIARGFDPDLLRSVVQALAAGES